MFRFNKSQKSNILLGDGDDDELFSGPSEKLASLFEDEFPVTNPKALKYVPPKQPSKEPIVPSALGSSVVEKQESNDTNSEVLFANAVKLFSYHGQETLDLGLVMCCVIYKKSSNTSILLFYKTKKNIITQAEINTYFQLTIQNDHYVAFTDASKKQWSLHLDGNKYEDFLFQVGICRANSIFANSTFLVIEKQLLSHDNGGGTFKEGDCPRVALCVWQVEKLRKGQLMRKTHENIEVPLTSDDLSWKRGLIGCMPRQHCVIFVKIDSESNFNIVAYEVTIEDYEFGGKISKNDAVSPDTSSMIEEREKSKKASLISRMAKVGQPLLPSTPRHIKKLSSLTTDSESEEDPSFSRRFRGKNGCQRSPSSPPSSVEGSGSNELLNQNISTSSSIEEIKAKGQKLGQDVSTSSNIPFHNRKRITDVVTGRQSPNSTSNVSHSTYQSPLQGTVIAYQPQPIFQQSQHHLQNPSVNSSDPLLSLLFSESRAQNTDLRVALSQLTQKIDLVYNKVNSFDQLNTPSVFTGGGVNSNIYEYDPQELLKQITTLVEQLQNYKEKVTIKDQKIEQLTQDYALGLKKTQALLEEKAEFLSLKNEGFESKMENEKRIQEIQSSKEQIIGLNKELEDTRNLVDQQKNNIDELTLQLATLQHDFKNVEVEKAKLNNELITLREEQSRILEEKQCLKSENLEIKKKSDEKTTLLEQTCAEKIMDFEIQNSNLKEEIETKIRKENELNEKLKSQEKTEVELRKQLEYATNLNLHQESYSKLELESELSKSQDLNLEKNLELKSKDELISELKSKIIKLEEDKIHAIRVTSANTKSFITGIPDGENNQKVDVESLGKSVMNSAYKLLKKSLSSHETYNKQNILENVIDAFRETILKYTEEKEVKHVMESSYLEDASKACEINTSVENISSNEVNKYVPEVENVSGSSHINTFAKEILTENKTSIISNDFKKIEGIATPPPLSVNSNTKFLENVNESFGKSSTNVTNENSIKTDSFTLSEATDPPALDIEKCEPNDTEEESIPEDNKNISFNKLAETSDSQNAKNCAQLKDEDDLTWKTGPPPPPPPLFSDSEDNDDWFT